MLLSSRFQLMHHFAPSISHLTDMVYTSTGEGETIDNILLQTACGKQKHWPWSTWTPRQGGALFAGASDVPSSRIWIGLTCHTVILEDFSTRHCQALTFQCSERHDNRHVPFDLQSQTLWRCRYSLRHTDVADAMERMFRFTCYCGAPRSCPMCPWECDCHIWQVHTYSQHTLTCWKLFSQMMFLSLLAVAFLSCPVSINARVWNDTGKGTIIFEEAWTIPELINQQKYVICCNQLLYQSLR